MRSPASLWGGGANNCTDAGTTLTLATITRACAHSTVSVMLCVCLFVCVCVPHVPWGPLGDGSRRNCDRVRSRYCSCGQRSGTHTKSNCVCVCETTKEYVQLVVCVCLCARRRISLPHSVWMELWHWCADYICSCVGREIPARYVYLPTGTHAQDVLCAEKSQLVGRQPPLCNWHRVAIIFYGHLPNIFWLALRLDESWQLLCSCSSSIH